MPKLPQVSGRRTVKVLQRVGFVKVSQKGSHLKLQRKKASCVETVIVPNHRRLKKGTLRNGILKPAGLSVEEFNLLLKKR